MLTHNSKIYTSTAGRCFNASSLTRAATAASLTLACLFSTGTLHLISKAPVSGFVDTLAETNGSTAEFFAWTARS